MRLKFNGLLVLLLLSGCLTAQDVFLKGRYVHLGVHSSGSFGTANSAPTGYVARSAAGQLGFVCDVGKDGFSVGTPNFIGDYFVPGSPEEGWGLQWNTSAAGTTRRNFNNFGLMGVSDVARNSHTKTVLNGSQRAEWQGTATSGSQKALVQQTVILDSLDQFFTIQILIKNVGTDPLYGLKYFRNVDPDHEQTITGDYTTINYVENQPGWGTNKDVATVVALGRVYKYPCILGAVDKRAKVSVGGFSVRTPDDVLGYTGSWTKSNPYDGDVAISLAFDLGKLDPGKCVTFVYFYSLQSIVPKSVGYDLKFVNTISEDKFKTSEKFNSKKYCFRDTVVQIKSDKVGGSIDFVDEVLWDTDNNGSFEKKGDSIEIKFPGFKKHTFKQRIVFCDGSSIDSVYTITLQPKPTAVFQVSSANRCFNEHKIEITNKSKHIRDTIVKYYWYRNDSLFSTKKFPDLHKISVFKPSYLYKLKCSTDLQCLDSIIVPMVLLPSPNLKVGMVDTIGCKKGNRFTTKNTLSIPMGKVKEAIAWGDGFFDTSVSNSTHTYANYGRYTVKTTAVSDSGCTAADSVKLHVFPQAIVSMQFKDTLQCIKGNKFIAAQRASVPYGSLSYSWRSNAVAAVSTDTSFIFKANNWGSYWIELATQTNYGCKDTQRRMLFVAPQPVQSVIVSDTQQCLKGNQWTIQDKSTVLTGSLKRYWEFNGWKDSGVNWKVSATKEGTYTLLMRSITNYGCSDTLKRMYTVHPQVSVDFAIANDSQCVYKNEFKTSNLSSIAYGNFVSKWVWGANEWVETSLNSTAKFPNFGERSISLHTQTDKGCKDTGVKKIWILPTPVPNFSGNFTDRCLKGNLYTTINNSSIPQGTLSYQWKISDSTSFNTPTISKRFALPKSYQVKLIAVSGFNCMDSTEKTVIIHPQTDVKIGVVKDSQCLSGNSYQMINNSSVATGLVSYAWTLDEGKVSALKTPSAISYGYFGKKNIQVIATTDKNCLDTFKRLLTVNDQPKASIQYSLIDSCMRYNRIQLYSTSTIQEGSYNIVWTIENQKFTDPSYWLYHFSKIGTFPVKLKVTSGLGCEDSTAINVNIHPTPTARFTVDSIVCFKGSGMNTFNLSTLVSGTMSYQWFDGIGNSVTGNTINNYKYPSIGNFPVSLVATSNKFCRDTFSKSTRVVKNSYLDIGSSNAVSCFKFNRFTINPVNANALVKPISNQWNWGDGSITTGLQSAHSYSAPGTYALTVYTLNQEGCTDTLYKSLLVRDAIVLGASGDSVCFPYLNQLVSSSYCGNDPVVRHTWKIGNQTVDGQAVSIKMPRPGYYAGTLSVETQSGCKDTLPLNRVLKVKPKPVADFELDSFVPQQVDMHIWLKNKSSWEVVNWDYRVTNSMQSNATNPTFTFQDTGYKTAWLKVISNENCLDTVEKIIGPFYPLHFQYVPNVFTPNGDGLNDCFAPTVSPYLSRFDLEIFNPWGQLIYQSNNFKGCWDGVYGDKEASAGAYIFALYIIDKNGFKHTERGTFMLIR